jgi:acyl-homoserine lactone acylase PvdQ
VLRRGLSASVVGLVCALLAGAPAAAQVQPYATNDYGGFRNVLPPGTNGFDDLAQAVQFETAHVYPPHSNDQLQMYAGLTTAAPYIQTAQIPQFFKDATFGVPAAQVAGSETPEAGVTIVRDKAFGVPHIYGDTRPALMFGIGYATAEDRLFMIDALRHAGSGDLAGFAGGANLSMDESVWASEPYTDQDKRNQINYIAGLPHGAQVIADAENYIAGINAYIAKAQSPLYRLTMLPAEYAAIGQPAGPAPFAPTDLVSIATLVGGIFGNGGGDQLQNSLLYEDLRARFGAERRALAGSPEIPAARHRKPKQPKPAKRSDHSGFASLLSFVAANDPEAPTTAQRRFPYQTLPAPSRAERATIALPDRNSVQFANPVAGGSGQYVDPLAGARAAGPRAPRAGLGLGPRANIGPSLFTFPRAMSNALLVSAAHSASGHALAVMGPQVSYYAPQILMEQDIHGPGIDADGAAFPGVNLYVELGHGPDYAWSATSAGQNIIDTFAVALCNRSGGPVSMNSHDYLLHGRCVAMETLTRHEAWTPNVADQSPAGSVTLTTQRTAYGLVIARARVHGHPVAYTNLRSTYMHELDSAAGFLLFNEPAAMRNPKMFMNAASHIGYTFNWFYADDKHIAYFNSGQNPVRAPHTDPLFPSWSADAWSGYRGAAATTPASLLERSTPPSAHPQAVDQTFITSWNNKQAPGYGDPATGQEFASVYRSNLLDENIRRYLSAGHGKLTLTDLINAMGNAGTEDLRGTEVLPYALSILGKTSDPALAHAIAELKAWFASGAHRINREHPGASGAYDQTDAVRIMDAWWPLLVGAEFGPTLGSRLLAELEHDFAINDQPGQGTSGKHLGSAFDVGFYGIVQKDLRAALHDHVSGPLNRVYCGGGSRPACRAALRSALRTAIGESPAQVYPGDNACQAGDQMCSDSIQFKAIGAITQPLIEWINRPTFQQAVEIQGHGPR